MMQNNGNNQHVFSLLGLREIHETEALMTKIHTVREYFSVKLFTMRAVVKSKCAVEKGNECTKKCTNSCHNDDLCADNQVVCSCKSCLKHVLHPAEVQVCVPTISKDFNQVAAGRIEDLDWPDTARGPYFGD